MKVVRLFLYSAGVLLLSTGVAKLVSSFGHENILHTSDPVVGVSFRNLFLFAGCLEIAVALICFLSKRILLQAGAIAWLSTGILFYRFGLWKNGWYKPCSCLGNLTDALHIPPQTADNEMKIILAYLLLGSYATLFWLWRQRKVKPLPSPVLPQNPQSP
jgi:hypothetical protein